MKKTVIISIVTLILISILLTACAPGTGRYQQDTRAGFFSGVWHGWIAPVSLIWHLFNPSVRIYETNNIGWLYDLGFYIAIIGGFGGLSIFRKKK